MRPEARRRPLSLFTTPASKGGDVSMSTRQLRARELKLSSRAPSVSSRALYALLALSLSCEGSPAKSASKSPADSAAFTDDFGNTVTFDSIPKRIVSLNPTTTEILFAIGAGPRLVGRTRWDSWPDSARFVPNVGDAMRPNVEAILATHPDLVVFYASNDNRPAEASLRKAHIKTVAFRIDSIEQFKR